MSLLYDTVQVKSTEAPGFFRRIHSLAAQDVSSAREETLR